MRANRVLLISLFLQLGQLVKAQVDKYDNEVVKRVICFCEHRDFTDYSKVGHVGIEVLTESGRKFTIHNLGPKGADAQVEPIHDCDLGRMRSTKTNIVKHITVGDLRKTAGTSYDFNLNNCYHARNRMLRYIEKDVESCPNGYKFESGQPLLETILTSIKTAGGIAATWCDSDSKYKGRSKCF